ncbi:MAG: UDP-glucose 4-epimerase GalE [Pseudomonadota bacterium]
MRVLVTGGTGYIGSHMLVELLKEGHEVVVLDNLCNSSSEPLQRVAKITGKSPEFVQGDVRDVALLEHIFSSYSPISAVIHFSGFKSVSESVMRPLDYFDNNLYGTVALCQAMAKAGVFRIVFSSSATVYGESEDIPFNEGCSTGTPTNPYARSKLMVEEMLRDLAYSDKRWSVALLRYFNPVGAHASGLIGEDPQGSPNNLLPYIAQVAVGRLDELLVFGGDYPTRDGTGVRDYIHVVDLARGHMAALDYLAGKRGVFTWNLGTGHGHSVLEVVRAFELASKREIPYRIVERRPGDIAAYWSDPAKAAHELMWRADRGLDAMMADTWRWQSLNPQGYGDRSISSGR